MVQGPWSMVKGAFPAPAVAMDNGRWTMDGVNAFSS